MKDKRRRSHKHSGHQTNRKQNKGFLSQKINYNKRKQIVWANNAISPENVFLFIVLFNSARKTTSIEAFPHKQKNITQIDDYTTEQLFIHTTFYIFGYSIEHNLNELTFTI